MSIEDVEIEDISESFRNAVTDKSLAELRQDDTISIIDSYVIDEYTTAFIVEGKEGSDLAYIPDGPELNPLSKAIRARVSDEIREILQHEEIEKMSLEERKQRVREIGREQIKHHRPIFSRVANRISERTKNGLLRLPRIEDREKLDRKLPDFKTVSEASVEKILYYLERDFVEYGKITPFLRDPRIEDIACNSPAIPTFIYHRDYKNMMTPITYGENELDSFVSSLSQRAKKHISISEPLLHGRLPDGSRIQLSYSHEISPDGSNFTIRKFKEIPYTPPELINLGTFSAEQMAFIWLCIENEQSMIFAGDTASGKTTSMNATSLFVPPDERIVSIEDTRELVLSHQNWVKSVTRDSIGGQSRGEIDMYELLRSGLRQRPDYIIVGEIRGEEARTLFQAMNTGHTTYSTMHASNPESMVHRLVNDPINLPIQMLESLDLISMQVKRYEGSETIRRCRELVEVTDINQSKSNPIETNKLFEYNPNTDEVERVADTEYIVDNIKYLRNWEEEDFQKELERRTELLEFLSENTSKYTYHDVVTIFRSYMRDPENIMERFRQDKQLVK